MKHLEQAFGHWVLKYRWLIIILCIALVFAAASGGKYLKFTTDYRVFFSADNPELLAFEAVENTYTKNDNVLFVLTPDNGNVFTLESLQAIEWLTKQAWQTPYSNRVDSISNFQHSWAQGDDLVVESLIADASHLSADEIAKIRHIALHEPLLINRTISADAKVAGVNITVQPPRIDETQETPEIVAFVRELRQQFEHKFPSINVRLTGMVLMNNAFSEASMMDMQTLLPLSFVVMLISLGLLIKGFTGTFASLSVIALSISAAMGLGGFFEFPLSPPSASAPIIILTIAIANSVHILVAILQQMKNGLSKNNAIIESLRINLQPVTLASVTTAIGFLTMNFSEVPPFQHLGNLVAVGVLISLVLSLTFLPALMSLLSMRVKPLTSEHIDPLTKLGDFIVVKHRFFFWGSLAVIVTLISFLPRNELNDVFVHYFDESVDFRADTDYTTSHLTGIYHLSYSLQAAGKGAINNPEFLQEVDAFAQWYKKQPETIHVSTYTDILKRLNKNMHGDDEAWYKLPAERELAAQYLLLYEMSLPYGLDLNNQINIDKSATRFVATLITLSSNDLLALSERADQWLHENTRHIVQAKASGPSLMFANIGKRNIQSMLIGTTAALLLISFMLIVAFRSLKIGLISLIPNLIPAAMGFGLWGLLVGEVGLALSVVSGMTLGIVVDDTVHFLSKYLRARREKAYDASAAVRYAFTTVGRPLMITTIVLVLGFAVLILSSFKLNSDMGLLTAIIISFALVTDFFFLPTLLIRLEQQEHAREKTKVTTGFATPPHTSV